MTSGPGPIAAGGFFLAVDGMAGAGKTTTVRLLREHLREHLRAVGVSRRVVTTAEPTDGSIGTLIRRETALHHDAALACLVAADRYHHLDAEIRPSLRQGAVVVCDRYVASSYVLQQMDDVPLDFVIDLNRQADTPDLTVFLVADPAVAADRVNRRGAHDRFQAGLFTSTVEARLYTEARDLLAARGVPVLTVDTTDVAPAQVTGRIAEHVLQARPDLSGSRRGR